MNDMRVLRTNISSSGKNSSGKRPGLLRRRTPILISLTSCVQNVQQNSPFQRDLYKGLKRVVRSFVTFMYSYNLERQKVPKEKRKKKIGSMYILRENIKLNETYYLCRCPMSGERRSFHYVAGFFSPER